MNKKIVIAAAAVLLCGGGAAAYFLRGDEVARGHAFKSICDKDDPYYTDLCDNVGKEARSLFTVDPVNDNVYGLVAGVAWRRKGNIISRPNEAKRFAPGNNYYYILCPPDMPSYCMLAVHTQVNFNERADEKAALLRELKF